ncbi:MAG: hypothetical protein K6V36_12660, partial [Anaerolineae bacterium]|nr:hypothetical protein [Anaerolineae bacterium]
PCAWMVSFTRSKSAGAAPAAMTTIILYPLLSARGHSLAACEMTSSHSTTTCPKRRSRVFFCHHAQEVTLELASTLYQSPYYEVAICATRCPLNLAETASLAEYMRETLEAHDLPRHFQARVRGPVLSHHRFKVAVAGCGVAAEYGYANAGIVYNDLKDRPTRYSGRGGLGSVMASRGLKFVVVDPLGAPGAAIADRSRFEQGRKKLEEALLEHAITKPKGGLNTYGTAILINILNEAGGLPTRNFSSGRFEGAARTAGEAIFEGNKQRLGRELYNHACSPGCIIQCSNTWHRPDGSEHVSCVEYESTWALGANCAIDSLDDIAELIRLCNAYGLDTIETGGTLGVAMEAGVIPFGDGAAAIRLVQEMGQGTPLGRLLGSGTESVGRAYGVTRVPTVKGQSMPAYEPRAVKGIGITYATSTMGADHTAGYTIAPEILGVSGKLDPLSPEGKAALSRAFQATTAFIDSTGHCLFIAFAILDIASGFEGMVEECNGVLGTNWTNDDVVRIGAEILKKERAFNEAAGIGKEKDRVPEFMKYEPLPPHDQVFDVPDVALDSVYAEL